MIYDANDRSSTDQYDDDGNTIVSSSITNTYDFEGHLLQRGNIKIVYDGDGNRVAKTVGGVTTQYLLSDVNPTRYPQVLEELQNSAVTRKYTYGLEMIDESQLISGGWQVSFYGYDGHGSVRNLTDVAGNVTDTYQYDVFGNLIRSTGSTPNLYLFAGQQFDPALNLYYSRARYLNVSTGRFITADAYEGNEEDPVSLHRYLYAGDDPANRIDPSGNFDIGDALAVSAMVGVLTSIATILYGQYVYRSKIDPKDRGNIIQRYIFPFYRGFGFKCNQWIGTLANPPVDRARPDMRHHGDGFFGSAFRGEVYEIKPNNPTQVALGFDEVQNFYIPRLDAHDQANGITTPWHPGTHLLAPPRMRIPEFPFIVFRLSIPVEGVVAYDPEADIEEAAKWGIGAFAITFFALTLLIDTPVPKPEPVPEPVPEPEPVPLPDAA
jgi:RHS repeat-associated protein